jgi:hypothetical protein
VEKIILYGEFDMTKKMELLSTTALGGLVAVHEEESNEKLIEEYGTKNPRALNQECDIDEMISVYEELGLVVLDLRYVD